MIRRATIIAVGTLKGWTDEGCRDYLKRLRRYFPLEVVEVSEEDLNRRTPEEVLAAEARRLLRRIPDGAYVISLDVLARADALVSFGPITLPHALARVVLLEQLYRAAKINRGERYHY